MINVAIKFRRFKVVQNFKNMNRKKFLKSLGLASGAVVAGPAMALAMSSESSAKSSAESAASIKGGCALIPSETPGPFPLDLTNNTYFFRQDIREGRPGEKVIQRMRIVGTVNCLPMPNVRVNIWCCDANGDYSGYGSEEGLTYMRAYQITDDNGEVEFISILPGWYPGRVVHMHFQVHVSTSYSAVSQYTWPHAAAVEIANASPEVYTQGPDPMAPESDGAFADGYEHQLATLVYDEEIQSYVSDLEVAVEGTGVDSIGYLEQQASKLFTLGTISPNPATRSSIVSLNLLAPSEVTILVFSISGAQVYERRLGVKSEGVHNISIDIVSMKLSSGSYVCQFNLTNSGRTHHDFRRFVIS